MKAAARRPGRPRTRPEGQVGSHVGFRAPRELKEKLEAAAVASGRSLSTEAQFRLEKSFHQQDMIGAACELAYGRGAAAIILVLAREMVSSGRVSALISSGGSRDAMADWLADAYAYKQAVNAATRVLDRFKPNGDPAAFKNDIVPEFSNVNEGKRRADITLAAVEDPKWGDQFSEQHKN